MNCQWVDCDKQAKRRLFKVVKGDPEGLMNRRRASHKDVWVCDRCARLAKKEYPFEVFIPPTDTLRI